jgi:flagellar FliL protein
MAEEKGGDAKDAPEAKAGKSKLLIILIAVAVLLGVGGGVAYFTGVLGGAGEAQAAKQPGGHGSEKGGGHGKEAGGHGEPAAHGEGEGVGSVAPLDPFVVNLTDEGAQRYLKVTMKLEFLESTPPAHFSGKQAQIRDLILTLLSSKAVGDVRTVEGKAQLRDEIIARVNRVLGDDSVKAVYFAEFIVQ